MEILITMVPNVGTMAFKRNKPYKAKDGTIKDRWYLVENHWENGESKQKVLKYLGASPNLQERQIDPNAAGLLANAIMSGNATPEQIKKLVEQLGIHVSGNIKRVSLIYNPPLRKLTLRIE
jgi:hypothetical protein